MYKFFLLLFVTFIAFHVKAQVNYDVFNRRTPIVAADSQKLTLNIYNFTYLHNTEYFTNIANSGTLFGYQLIPELQYQPSPRLLIKAGLYAQKEFGREEYTSLLPTFTVKYKGRLSHFLLGNLEGNINHRFIEPIYDNKLIINERMENGFQFIVDSKPYYHDYYINWRRAIHLGDPFKEEFDIGYSAHFNLTRKENFKIKMPVQMLYSHKGGQIDITNEPLTSLVNSAVGLSLDFGFKNSFLRGITFDNYYVNYKDISGHKRQPFKQGNGFLSHALFHFKYFDLDLRYWDASGFINPRGNVLFSSVSEKYPGLTEKRRQLLLSSFIYDTRLFKEANFNFRISPYYDFIEEELEYSFEMYFSYRLQVLLAKIKNHL